MWIFIWIVLSLFILGIFGWSVVILQQQKRAWAMLAKKYRLEYDRRKMMESAVVRGVINGVRLSITSEARQTTDVRGERYTSVIEMELGSGMPTAAAIGTHHMAEFISSLSFQHRIVPEHPKWTSDHICKVRDVDAFNAWATTARKDALLDVFSMKNVVALFFFDEVDCLLHIETTDPLRRADKLDRIIQRLIRNMKVLSPDSGTVLKPLPPLNATPETPMLEPTPLLVAETAEGTSTDVPVEPVIADSVDPVLIENQKLIEDQRQP